MTLEALALIGLGWIIAVGFFLAVILLNARKAIIEDDEAIRRIKVKPCHRHEWDSDAAYVHHLHGTTLFCSRPHCWEHKFFPRGDD